MKYIFLDKEFYIKYKHCNELEKKEDRPYAMLLMKIDDITWAIPLRSNISHKHVVWSNKDNKCGLDLSKAIVIEDICYVSKEQVWIRQNEFEALKGKEHYIYTKMKKYINTYIKAYIRRDIKRNELLCTYSTLQYFHDFIPELNDLNKDEVAIDIIK